MARDAGTGAAAEGAAEGAEEGVAEAGAVDRIRAFNRLWLRRMALLDASYLGSGMTLTEVRVLYELAHHPGQSARALAQGLRLDEGHLSRLLAGFARRGWLARRPDPGDARRRHLALTPAGQAGFAPLEDASRAAVAEAVAGLTPAGLGGLVAALDAVEAALDPPRPALRDLQPGDAGWVVARHGALYARDEGYDAGFEALVARILADFLSDHDPSRERGWIAAAGSRRLGSIFCVRGARPEEAKLRLFLVEPEARGTGLAQELLDACTGFARATGYGRMVLWTHESHRAAVRLYQRNGWVMTSATPGQAFGQAVVDQEWALDL